MRKTVTLYAVSSCPHCKSTRNLLNECGIEFDLTEVDRAPKDCVADIMAEIKKLTSRSSFPTLVIDDTVIVGFHEDKIREALGMTEVEKLYEMLRKVQEPKGYYFSNDKEKVFELLAGLIVNKERYGYMCCPCRLACNDREWDKDIICPCVYRAPDVAEFGSCYCNLYVSTDWNDEKIPHEYVPERRPMEKFRF